MYTKARAREMLVKAPWLWHYIEIIVPEQVGPHCKDPNNISASGIVKLNQIKTSIYFLKD
jgi:hypothetical protein